MTGDTANALYTIDSTTGVATRVGSAENFGVGETCPESLAWHEGRLFMVGCAQAVGTSVDALYTLDPHTGVATLWATGPQLGFTKQQATFLKGVASQQRRAVHRHLGHGGAAAGGHRGAHQRQGGHAEQLRRERDAAGGHRLAGRHAVHGGLQHRQAVHAEHHHRRGHPGGQRHQVRHQRGQRVEPGCPRRQAVHDRRRHGLPGGAEPHHRGGHAGGLGHDVRRERRGVRAGGRLHGACRLRRERLHRLGGLHQLHRGGGGRQRPVGGDVRRQVAHRHCRHVSGRLCAGAGGGAEPGPGVRAVELRVHDRGGQRRWHHGGVGGHRVGHRRRQRHDLLRPGAFGRCHEAVCAGRQRRHRQGRAVDVHHGGAVARAGGLGDELRAGHRRHRGA